MNRIARRTAGVAFSALLAVAASAGKAQAGTTENLVRNGDAELHRCTSDWTAQTPVAGWHVLRGAASVLCYAAFATAGDTPLLPSPPAAGGALFAAPGADTAIEQAVDVSGQSATIDTGTATYSLSAWLGGWRDRPEQATLTAVFLDAARRATGYPVVLARGDARLRGNATALLEQRAQGRVPAGTRSIVLTVHFVSGMNSYNNAYADNISLRLNGDFAVAQRPPPPAPVPHIPRLDHVFVVMMENTNYADVVHSRKGRPTVDDRQMPFLASLARDGVLLANMWANYHPSDENYVAMVAGDTYRFGPAYFPYNLDVKHLGDLLDARNRPWRAYVQHMRTPCNLTGNASDVGYAPDAQPFSQFLDVIGDPARCAAHLRDLADFQSDIVAGSLPDFAWIAADAWWDGEGAWFEKYDVAFSNARQDEFLRTTFQPLVASRQWKKTRSLLIITWDESGGWGWPDNRVPTVVVGSPGLLHAGSVVDEHYDGYSILRTLESGLGLGGLERFDDDAQALDAVFAVHEPPAHADAALWPDEAAAMRGSIADTFGRSTTPAAVYEGESFTLLAHESIADDTVVSLAPLGEVPGAAADAHRVDRKGGSVVISTQGLPPGTYGAWVRHGLAPPHRAPVLFTVLPRSNLDPEHPGVEIPGGVAPEGIHGLREGANLVVRYCRPAGTAPSDTWLGIFPAGTSPDRLTQPNANGIGYWLRTPGSPAGAPCGEAPAYAAELAPGQEYQVSLLRTAPDGSGIVIGRTAMFKLTPALPGTTTRGPVH